jgi:hypothetical protein
MRIGEPVRELTVEPVVEPVPRAAEAPPPEREPAPLVEAAGPPAERELVPA